MIPKLISIKLIESSLPQTMALYSILMSFKGVNYGKLDIAGENLRLSSLHGGTIFQIPFAAVSNSTMNKNDIIVETASEEVGNEDCLCEIRFHVEEQREEGQIEVQGEEESTKTTFAQEIYQRIVERAKIGEFAGESMATLIDVNLAVPRGKYTIDFYQKNLRFHGITFNYNVDYKNISKGFILPMMNEAQVCIVLQLNKDKPIYQGQTVYRYIVIQVKKQLESSIKTKVNPDILEKHPHLQDLKAEYVGPLFQIFVDLIKTTTRIVLVQPGEHFKSKAGQPCLKCNVKAQPGWLYLMKQAIIFIPKPVLYFKVEDILEAEFTRLVATNKQFDMKITLKEDKKTVEFMGIERPELDVLVDYMKTRSVKVKMEQEATKIIPDIDEDESQDQDFQAEADESEDDDESSSPQELGSEQESKSNEKGQKGEKKRKNEDVKKEN